MENGKKMNHILLGAYGEHKAVNYLKKKKFKILETNHKNLLGEIDIIAKDKKVLVFVEVKTRSNLSFSMPAYAVDKKKRHKLKTVATLYLKQKNLLNAPCRFDVIEVLKDEINHIINAF